MSVSIRDYYKILLVGQSGKGKTYSFRNMVSSTTGFINVENKPLPFKNNFKYHARPINAASVFKALEDFSKNDEITVIVIDSFSDFAEMLLEQCRRDKKGFDIWNEYNLQVGRLFNEIKKVQKELIITGHYEILNIEGAPEKRLKIKGKEWEGLGERVFTNVLYAEDKYDDTGKANYWFRLAGEGISAKFPPDIFGPNISTIPNDSQAVVEKIWEFVKQ